MPVHVGTSGWQYRDWRGRSSPAALPDAVTLAGLLRGVGRTPTRVPEMAAVSGELVDPRRR